MAKKKTYGPARTYSTYEGQSARYRLIGPIANMTIEELDRLQWELTSEYQLREAWRTLATSSAAYDEAQTKEK
jgi:hypothetical protein